MELRQMKVGAKERKKTKKDLRGEKARQKERGKEQCSGCSSDVSISQILYGPKAINALSWAALIGSNFNGLKWKWRCGTTLYILMDSVFAGLCILTHIIL